MTSLGSGLSNLATLLFNCPIRGIIPIISGPLLGVNNDEEHYEVLAYRQIKIIKTKVFPKIMFLFPQCLL